SATAAARGIAAALRLRPQLHRLDVDHADIEDLLDRGADRRLVRIRVDSERVFVLRDQGIALLRDDRANDHLARIHQALSSECPAATLVSSSSAGSETTTDAAPSTSATPASAAGQTSTRAMFRNDFAQISSSSP